MTSAIPAQEWFPSGNDYLVDGLWGRLGFQKKFGETLLSGATNGLAAVEDPKTGNTFLYAGAVNGGLYLRTYKLAENQWSENWTWLSGPGSDYTGSQGIAILSTSPDGTYLAVGNGNPSNYAAVAPPSNGLQIARINPDGSLAWIPIPESVQSQLDGLNIRSLSWSGDRILGTSWDPIRGGSAFSVFVDDDSLVDLQKIDTQRLNLNGDSGAGQYVLAGYDAATGSQTVLVNGKDLIGDKLNELVFTAAEGIARVSVYPELVDGKLITFIGTVKAIPSKVPIWRVLRLEIAPDSGELLDFQTTNPNPPYLNETDDLYTPFGSNQANNSIFYGNFSFEVDPYDPAARTIFVGGNQYSNSPLAATPTYAGGLVRVSFDGMKPTLTPLYGPKVERSRSELKSGEVVLSDVWDGELAVPFSPGAPHADSRTITFYRSTTGPRILQTDDGGVWELQQKRTVKGLYSMRGEWWKSLSGPGMATLELNQVDWNSAHNAIVSSYQDNASSIGYFGESSATNIDSGDGQLALFDDADPMRVKAYVAAQQYYTKGYLVSINYDAQGFARNVTTPKFYLSGQDGSYIPWKDTAEATLKNTPFILPVATNPYQPGSLIQTGLANIYESIDPGQFKDVALLFRELLPRSSEQQLTPTALSFQGTATDQAISSLYVGGYLPTNDVVVLGRPSSDDASDYELKPLAFNNLTQDRLTEGGQIVAITQAGSLGSSELVYWLQGGLSLNYGLRNKSTPATQQVLRFGRDGENVETIPLSQLGLPFAPGDLYGYQDVQYLPATDYHGPLLLIAGLNGVWSSPLNQQGQPTGFSALSWQGLPDSGPGTFIKSMQYDPVDDLLIAATQGKGSYIYSFSGQIEERSQGRKTLHASDLNLPLFEDPALDKRGNELNAQITISLDSRLLAQDENTRLEFTLHKAPAWRRVMEFVSVYNTNVSPAYKTFGRGGAQAFQYFNILNPVGLSLQGGEEQSGDLSFSVDVAAGASIFNLQVNVKDRKSFRGLRPLKYTVSLEGTGESLTRKVSFESLPPLPRSVVYSEPDLLTADVIIGPQASAGVGALQLLPQNNLDSPGVALDPVDGSIDRAGDQLPTPSSYELPGLLQDTPQVGLFPQYSTNGQISLLGRQELGTFAN